MNFDELKKQWDNQPSDEVIIESNLETKNQANTVIDMVRKVMKKDFYYYQLPAFPLILLYPFILDVYTPIFWWTILCVLAIMIVPLFYLVKFYNSSYKLEYNSLRNINWFYYNYKSSIKIYSLYYYVFSILVILLIGIKLIECENDVSFDSFYFIISFTIFMIIYVFFTIKFLKWWVNKLYKKPLIQLEEILNQLEE
ncbi:hypothetical protein [Faecalibacter macacae]|uniref:Uncharacterized protein n=1 Tax=Faecalibacter macacae TaxID=1859289 RepID=A0A3L9MN32_9FLAO|nr:hypothetical protein [Faecalibacter macacae]RLZ12634.1 hypothetical protein EAH69_00305 [Faecalibacter macacae]